MRIFLAIYVFAIIAAVSILGFRGSISTKPPLEVFPDMDRQARYKPQAENDFFADGRNDRQVPAGTVARGDYFNQVEVFSEDFEDPRLGDTVFNQGKNADGSLVKKIPVEVSYELIQQGKEKYDIFCSSCHGAAGDGNGVTKPYGVLAANYHDARLRSVEDGHIFDVITNGKGLMLPFNDRISPEERWAIVLYVRALQLSQNANAEELTAVQRTELGL
ncbi:cytochrome c [Coraliomargarita sp. SDUM461003]|uniref:Cytochrome c n=1 Tax=Thalassobacterium maritimum TaxID=3041265 RepID=A0ABU1AW62_9BACT|nr:cytochrome c [Coraliomargarita sp. SDUM461003]MDQ8208391.1 cytochrome c [Coraliomargarita sp. SDUM461003]